MERKKLLLIIFLVFLIFMSLSYVISKPTLTAFTSLSGEKCNSLNEGSADDCWHSLAHQTFKKEYCLKIIDNEKKEHCLEHIPENK